MAYFVFLVILFVVLLVIYWKTTEETTKQQIKQSASDSLLDFLASFTSKEQEPKVTVTAYREYSIKGINFRVKSDSLMGDFTGTVRAETDNKYDPYAIAVYRGNMHIGYLPRDNRWLYKEIMSKGGVVHIEGYISKLRDEENGQYFYYGKVWLPARL